MTKTISVGQLAHGGSSRAIRQAEQEPVLVSKENRPAAWIVSAEQLAKVAAALGDEPATIYRRVLALLAAANYQHGGLSLGQAAKLADLSLGDFIDLCGELRIPILWPSEAGLAAEEAAAAALVGDPQPARDTTS